MRFKRPPDEDETEGSVYGEANHATETPHDERQLYGEPCHEVGSRDEEQTLYGDPQHEIRENPDLPDIDLLLARLRSEPIEGPTVLASRENSSAVRTTER